MTKNNIEAMQYPLPDEAVDSKTKEIWTQSLHNPSTAKVVSSNTKKNLRFDDTEISFEEFHARLPFKDWIMAKTFRE